MKILGNSICSLVFQQKRLLYRSCILPITLYGFQLWFYNNTPLSYPLKELNKIQRRATIWILGAFCTLLSGMVHTGVEVYRMDSEMSGLVERPWLQLMCCAICLPCGRNFRWREESLSGSEYWLVCRHWTPEIEFNKSLSSSIIRLANYSVTTSLIYERKV